MSRRAVWESLARSWCQVGPPSPDAILLIEAQLDAHVALGHLDAKEAAAWRERLRVAARDDGRVLEQFADVVAREVERTFAAHETVEAVAPVLGALEALGATDHATARAWFNRLGGLVPPPPSPFEQPPMPSPEMARPSSAPPTRVVAGPLERRDGMRIASVAIADDYVDVRWHFASPREDWPPRRRFPHHRRGPIDLADDAGTEYFGIGGGATRRGPVDGPSAVIGNEQFVPAPPPGASRLVASYGVERFEIPLA
jgi:hypothetical protein